MLCYFTWNLRDVLNFIITLHRPYFVKTMDKVKKQKKSD